MKRIVFFCLSLFSVSLLKSQDLDKTMALQLVAKNGAAIGLTKDGLNNSIVSNAYFNRISGIELVYLQQSYKGVPILNQVQSLAFKNGELVSKAGKRISDPGQLINNVSGLPVITPEAAVRTAFRIKNLPIEESIASKPVTGTKKFEFGNLGSSSENVTAELMWVPVNDGRKQTLKLAWQVFLAPKSLPDMWLVRIDAERNDMIGEQNLTIYCNWDKKSSHHHALDCLKESNTPTAQVASTQTELSPLIVNGASYRVIPFPAESPKHPGGAPAIVTDPWTAAPGNATTLKWHSDGTSDFNYTRGNNVWSYHDRTKLNTPDVTRSATSSTGPDPLTFNFIPDFSVVPSQASPTQNQQFNITNLFYWNNIIHDVLYQYGFDEVSGNFQASNLARGGLGNDYVRAEAQDGGGTNNANFSTGVDGNIGRMQMFLWDGPSKGITVNTPSAISGNYVAVESDFSSANKLSLVGPVTGQVVYYNDDATGTTHFACQPPVNAVSGKIALIDRGFGGICTTAVNFTVKAKNAQNAGAIGVIVINNVAGAPGIMGPFEGDNTITIPAVMISQADGALLAAQVGNNLNVTLNQPLDWDGDVDNGVIVHEFCHGLSNRLTGGPAQASCLSNAEQMGEGWSDFYALMFTQDWKNATVNTGFTTPRGIGTYANGEGPTGAGIRTQPYSTNFAINNKVYSASLPSSQHDRGEFWCAALWDMTWSIIQQVNSITPSIYNGTGTGGNIIALKLVTEGMKLQPCSPGFIDGRDAILKADQILYGGQFSCAIREAFRRRGMGAFASQGSSNDVNDQTADFSPYLSLNLTQNVTQIPEGQNIVYTNRVTSCGPISNFLLTDTLPLNVTYVSGGSYNAGTRVVSFPVTFASAGSQNFVFTVMANNGSYFAPTTYLDEQVPTTTFPATLTQTSNSASVWSVSSSLSHSAPNSVFTPDAVGISEQLLSTANGITLGANQSSLAFWHNYNTEVGYDGGVIEISTDNGSSWSDLGNKTILGYYNGQIDAGNGIPISGKRAYTGNSNGFIKTSVDLSSYAGQTARFRWAFYSDPFEGGPGWYVDDILIKNEAVVNMRTSLLNASGVRLSFSDTVTLITQTVVCSNVAINSQPANTTVCAGANAGFTVAATGTTVNYQWQVSTDGGATYTNITGAVAATLSLPAVTAAMNNYMYKVIVSNNCPSSVTSSVATLFVTTPSAITSQPAGTTVCTGSNASFTVTATGPSLTYQWEVSTNGGASWATVPGAVAATLTLTGVTTTLNNNQYRVKISSCVPGGLTSNAATLIVNTAAGITSQPLSATVCAGGNASFGVAATGTAVSYQWQVSTDGGGSFANIPGANSATLNLPGVTAGMNNYQYKVIVSNACPSTVTSAAATLAVTSPSVITIQPSNTSTCSGNNTSFAVTATGTSLTYQWQVSTNNGTTWNNITGATSASLSLTAVTVGMNNNQYRVVISSCTPGGLISNAAALTVNAGVGITTQPVNATVCTGTNTGFSVSATGTALGYQWQVSTNGGSTFTDIPGAISASLNLGAAAPAMNNNQYRVIVSNACPSSLTSTAASLSVSDVTVISSQPANATVCAGTNATFSVTATGTNLTYQWQVSTDAGITWANIAGATGSGLTLSTTSSLNNNRYRVVLPSCVPGGLNSAPATLTVNDPVIISTQPASKSACTGTNVTFTSVVTGTILSRQWQLSTDGGATWADIPGATNSNLTLNAVTASMNDSRYRVTLTGTCSAGTLTSNVATLTINNSVTISQHPVNSVLCAGLNTSFSTVASGSGLTYQWQVSTNGGSSFTNIAGANTSILNINSVTPAMNANQYRVALNGDCVSNLFTNAAVLTVNSSVTIVTQPVNQVGCDPVPAVFRVTATGTSVTYQWEMSTDVGGSWATITGATNNILTIPSLTPDLNGHQYRVKVSGVPCGTLTSNAATLTVGQLPTVTLAANTTSISPSSAATLTATPNPSGSYTYQWFKNNTLVPGASSNTLVVGIDNVGTYKVIGTSSNGCSNVSNELAISGAISKRLFVYPNPNFGLFQVRLYTDQPTGTARTINVFDARGAKILTKVFTVLTQYDKMEVDISWAAGGVYYIEVLDASGKRVGSAGITKF